jgi:2',3'-cyclic-nucleotide 2'-phosphodiesterase (5'-nucleotidase family)
MNKQTASARFICVNDVYSFLPNKAGLGGFAQLPSAISLYNHHPNYKTILAGDFLGGSSLAVNFKGKVVQDVVNQINFDYLCLGNHEFDYGVPTLKERMRESNSLWFGSNIRETQTGQLFEGVSDHTVWLVPTTSSDSTQLVEESQQECVRIGVFGVCTEQTPKLAYPGPEVTFESVMLHVERKVRELREVEKVDVVVALTHVSVTEDESIARQVPGIDVIIGGHDHHPYTVYQDGTLIFKCGQNAEYLGVIDLACELNFEDGKRTCNVYPSWKIQVAKDLPLDQPVLDILHSYEETLREQRMKRSFPLATVEGLEKGDVLSTKCEVVRKRESAFGNLVADAMHFYFQGQGCDLGIINGGYIRRDYEYPAGYVLSAADLDLEMPFTKSAKLVQISGENLGQALEYMLSAMPFPAGYFPHISSAVRIEYDPNKPPMERIQSFTIAGQALQNNKQYRISISDFMAIGGDANHFFTLGEVVNSGTLSICDLVVDFLQHTKRIQGKIEGRIKEVTTE